MVLCLLYIWSVITYLLQTGDNIDSRSSYLARWLLMLVAVVRFKIARKADILPVQTVFERYHGQP